MHGADCVLPIAWAGNYVRRCHHFCDVGESLAPQPLWAGMVQMQAQLGCVDHNVIVILAFLAEAARKGCDLVLFSEPSFCDYTVDPAQAKAAAIPEGQIADKLTPITGACQDTGTTVELRCILADGPCLYIAAVAVDRSGIKKHLSQTSPAPARSRYLHARRAVRAFRYRGLADWVGNLLRRGASCARGWAFQSGLPRLRAERAFREHRGT